MKPIRVTGEATVPYWLNVLLNEFEYPDADTLPPAIMPGGGGGMAHILIVSTSEPDFVQQKADYVVSESNSGPELQAIFDSLGSDPWSIWMAGVFVINDDVTTPSTSWIRGLGYTVGSA